MIIESFEIGLNFDKKYGKNNQFSFQCPYNNQTNFNDLLEIISILFPEKKLCPCFKYEIEKEKKTFISINKSDNIKEYIKSINSNAISLKIYKDKKCNCQSYYEKYNQKPKKEVIDDLFNFQKQTEIYINENNNYKTAIEDLKKDLNEIKKENESTKKNMEKDLENLQNKVNEIEKENKQLKSFNYKDYDNLNEIHTSKKLNSENEEKKNSFLKNVEFENFYDVIIDIKSIKDIKRG